jgi:tight adherence protein B
MGSLTIGLAALAALAAGWLAALLFLSPLGVGRERPRDLPRTGPGRSFRRRLYRALPLVLGAVVMGLTAYLILGLIAPAVVLAALGWGAAAAHARWRQARAAARLGAALLGAVDLLAQLLPAGHSTRQALVVLAESGPAELRPEVTRILTQLDDMPMEEALLQAQWRLRQPLFTLIASTLTVGNRSGGRLAPLLQELSRAAHQIDAVQGQLRAEQAQGRLGALVIAAMPLALLALVHEVNPEYLAPYSTVGGQFLLGGLIALVVLGYAWMLRILRLPEPDLLPLAPQTRRPRSGVIAQGLLALSPVAAAGAGPAGAGRRDTPASERMA